MDTYKLEEIEGGYKSREIMSLVDMSMDRYKGECSYYYKPGDIEEWDFKGYNSNVYTHGLHQYPAKFVPQLVRKVLRVFTDEGSVILDNFMGSGTVLVEGMLLRRRMVIGIELNPFAYFMAKVKTTSIEPKRLRQVFYDIRYGYSEVNKYDILRVSNIGFWFKPQQVKELSILRGMILEIGDRDIRDFFLLCMSEVIRKVSLTDHNEYKLCRDKGKVGEGFNPHVMKYFGDVVSRNIALMSDFYNKVDGGEVDIRGFT